jgi:peptide/nickel transport system permease protein
MSGSRFMPVLLWTDALVFLLVAALCVFAWTCWRSETLRQGWGRVASDGIGMGSAVVLAVFVGIGLLDSLHFRPALDKPGEGGKVAYSVDVLSVLDLLVAPLRERRERTYSAPLAAVAFQKETLQRPDGSQVREFPRLRHGGAHLSDPEAGRIADVALRTGGGMLVGLLAAAVFCAGWVAAIARSRRAGWRDTLASVWRGGTGTGTGTATGTDAGTGEVRGSARAGIHWRAFLLTVSVLLVLVAPVVLLSAHYHVLGTSKIGQSVLYLSLKSIRTSLVIGTLTTLVLMPFAVLLGIAAGYFKGWVDDLIQYVYTTIESIPSVLLIAAGVLLIQVYMETRPGLFETSAQRADFRLLMLCVILGLANWTGLCRLLRGEALKLRELEYVQAAHAFGVSHWRIIVRHLAPNMLHIVLISAVMGFSGLVLAEAVLSYVGVGVDPSMISFGTMINDARLEMAREPMVWWSLAAAFGFMLALVLAANLFADAVRDAFDPRSTIRRAGFRIGPARTGGRQGEGA